MSLAVSYLAKLSVEETLQANVPAASPAKAVVTHDLFNTAKTLNGASSPPATLHAAFEAALEAGVGEIDLTALVGTNEIEVDGTGLRIQALRLKAKATNANPITISQGAENGYNGLGADFSLTLAPGAEALLFPNDAGSDIGGANKVLDLAGTGAQVLQVQAVLG